jgi:hypothetical protein
MRRILSAVAAVLVVLIAGATTALAAGPTITDQRFAPGAVPWGPTCGSEPLMVSFSVDLRTEEFFDSGVPVLLRRHLRGGGTVWLNSTGRSLPYDVDFTSTFDTVTRINTITGQWAHVIIPGSGVIFQNSGRLIQDQNARPPLVVDESNAHDYFDPGGVAQLCAALGA